MPSAKIKQNIVYFAGLLSVLYFAVYSNEL